MAFGNSLQKQPLCGFGTPLRPSRIAAEPCISDPMAESGVPVLLGPSRSATEAREMHVKGRDLDPDPSSPLIYSTLRSVSGWGSRL